MNPDAVKQMSEAPMRTFGELSREEQLALFSAWLDGKEIEAKLILSASWAPIESPHWSPTLVYRIAPPKVVKPSINWDHVQIGFNYLFKTSGNGDFYVSTIRPRTDGVSHFYFGSAARASGFASFKPGENCPWDQSLVCRPGYE